MISRRPSIFIYTSQPDMDFLREIRAGIEEEGVFCEVFLREGADLDTLAYEAANDSMLGSGIGLCGVDAAMQMRGLKKDRTRKVITCLLMSSAGSLVLTAPEQSRSCPSNNGAGF